MEWETTAQAAKRLKLSTRSIRYYCESGRLESQRVGRDWLIAKGAKIQAVERKPYKPRDKPPDKPPHWRDFLKPMEPRRRKPRRPD